ncbi:MAG: nuclear transport factor 2 family protein [Bacteroidetes bacterium]|nr:nuclear transport factor 2 family protein [Bacteroidota bacterium]
METKAIRFLMATSSLFILLLFAQELCAQDATLQKTMDILTVKDSLLFNAAFNTCDLNTIEKTVTKDFEFWQVNGDVNHSTKQTQPEFISSIKTNFCDAGGSPLKKMKRDVEPGSIRIFPIGNDEVLQTGIQHFYTLTDGNKYTRVEESKFTRRWKKENGEWKMSKEFDEILNNYPNHPNTELYNTIARMDSVLFNAYNAHDVNEIKKYFTEDLEFYHDKGGLSNYTENVAGFTQVFQNNKDIRRDLVPGTLDVYPVKNFGAMEIGEHRFCHTENGQQVCGTFKFAMIWQLKNGEWKISRVISYGH